MKSTVKKLKLYYDPIKKTWGMKKPASALKLKSAYWGANKTPLPSFHSQKLSSPWPNNQLLTYSSSYRIDGKNVLVGPLIGILAAKGTNFPFLGNQRNFIDLILTGQKQGAIVYVFTPDQINWEQEQINGWIYQSSTKKWMMLRFPFPNVIYNRICNRQMEATSTIKDTLNKFKGYSHRITLFNPHFFNKQDIFEHLQNSDTLSQQLPDTEPLYSKKNLQAMLQKHSAVYLKPTKGKAGLGIIKISRDPHTNRYLFTTQTNTRVQHKRTSSFNKLWELFKEKRIPSPYIIQQGIDLAKLAGRPFDFRVLVQKNLSGQWALTGIGTRVAGHQRITTHVPRGGRIESSTYVLEQLYPNQTEEMLKRIRQLALSLAKEIERPYTLLGEMSMDIGMDQQGGLWFFEANAKPMKFDEPTIRSKSLKNIIDYSKYLTFSSVKEFSHT